MAELTCPYCYERFAEREILFRCAGRPGPKGTCPRTRDELLAARTGLARPLPPVFRADAHKTHAVHADCGLDTATRICPRCHSQLPGQFGKVDSRTVALIGARESGKTVFMTVLMHELMNRVGQRFDAAVMGSDDETRSRFANDFEGALYDKRELPGATTSAGTTNNWRAPLVFRFTREQRGRFGGRTKHTLLSFFDTAGEDLRTQESVELNVRYLDAADAVILLLDPLQMPAARRQAVGYGRSEDADGRDNPANILGRVTDLLQSTGGGPSDKIRKPMAVAFSKMDTLRHTFRDGSPLTHRPSDEAAFDVRESEAVHADVQALLYDWDGAQLDQILRHNYRRYRYFAVSALGDSPTADQRVSDSGVRPLRVEDPFLWLMSELGTIPTTKG